ncbi:DUF349 domain-containing protein [Bacteroidales bacterium OttesenSCG-928-I14]|nr:DUF349 domain-containing protein [Bacteroidales bacterium OttesenSCG-928-I14]
MIKHDDPERIANESAAEQEETKVTPTEVTEPVVEKEENSLSEQASEEAVIAETPQEEIKEEVATAETEVEAEAEVEIVIPEDRQGIIEVLTLTVEEAINESTRKKVEVLKQGFYKIKRVENEETKKAFIEAGNAEEDFKVEEDELDAKLKELLSIFKEKKAAINAEAEKVKEENLARKKEIIEKIKEMIESKDDFYKVYNEFRKLQAEWKEIKQVPQSAINDIWKEYQHYSEKFYDLVKINNEMRDYDFKKNLELKQNLIEAVERLENEADVVSAFYQLQNLHQEWREIGPVARELREDIWTQFKDASSVINKKHQQYFEELRGLEQRNLDEKTALCEEMEAIDYDKLTTFKEWDEKNKHVLELQDKWKTIGFAPKKYNVKIFERFRAACDVFFSKKGEFYKNLKGNMDENMAKKTALCEQAEALKDSQDWKSTSDKFIALQKEWKAVGPVPRKQADIVWKRFITACDFFFEEKKKHFSSQKTEEVENLKLKKDIIERINSLDQSLPAKEAVSKLHEFMAEFNQIGFVPFRDKDKIYKEYRAALDSHFDRLKVDESTRRLESFKNNFKDIDPADGKSKNRLLSEREKLMRTYERLKGDIQTYENNIGFLSISSKGGGGLVKEMQRKIESLKEELVLIEKKIEVVDGNLGFNN